MAVNSSDTLVLGQQCPDFSLISVEGHSVHLKSISKDKRGLVVAFWCNHCPYVKAVEDRFLALARTFLPKNIQFVTICANDPQAYPEDEASKLFVHWQAKNFAFPYLIDTTQQVAKSFDARCTPDIFVFDNTLKLYYHGQIDDNWKNPLEVKSQDLKSALEGLISGQAPPQLQKPTIGCSIKWKS